MIFVRASLEERSSWHNSCTNLKRSRLKNGEFMSPHLSRPPFLPIEQPNTLVNPVTPYQKRIYSKHKSSSHSPICLRARQRHARLLINLRHRSPCLPFRIDQTTALTKIAESYGPISVTRKMLFNRPCCVCRHAGSRVPLIKQVLRDTRTD